MGDLIPRGRAGADGVGDGEIRLFQSCVYTSGLPPRRLTILEIHAAGPLERPDDFKMDMISWVTSSADPLVASIVCH